MKFRPLHDRVLIKVLDSEAKTAGGQQQAPPQQSLAPRLQHLGPSFARSQMDSCEQECPRDSAAVRPMRVPMAARPAVGVKITWQLCHVQGDAASRRSASDPRRPKTHESSASRHPHPSLRDRPAKLALPSPTNPNQHWSYRELQAPVQSNNSCCC